MGDDVGPEAFMRQLEAIMSRADSRPLLPSIKCPTLILTSDTDNTVPNAFSTELADNHPGRKTGGDSGLRPPLRSLRSPKPRQLRCSIG